MAVSFSELHTVDGLKALEKHLTGKTYISREQISKDDVKVFAAVPSKPGAEFSNAARWYETVAAALGSRFPGKAAGVNLSVAGSSSAPAAEASKDAEDDDGLDLFGDETEDNKKAAERAAAKPAKKKESGKSSALMDIKPWDDETDMQILEEKVRGVHMEGLTWGASRLVAVGGIKKLQIMMTIVDDFVSVADLIEEVLCAEPINEYVQSCDIVAFHEI
ncbi:elongation factor 1-beta [Brachypodium distachyon]|uniref:Translation elongation factor EF1B beta/delta subunit guanine nucleotide exchange domain-containing protein n=1 Tax=Brachypodium distachyon TaxID=15368 RepID=I1GRG2_BRADI|nr:elongation factor 1-beta [Brachypodium distachyon]KQK14804.1 hypothetical protein BRADI_1g18690v3 [Brachypodium distachyon]|eukprot:XP_003562505.1 elongation factor 1-beta [Brachypodium distachyon]